MQEPVYILIRTSRRPLFFQRCIESIKEQTYENIVTIVHSDDPRDEYVTGDIIIKGSAFSKNYGAGSYNLYNNRLLAQIPDGDGWYCFMDDDDEYESHDIIERLVSSSLKDHINIARVKRWGDKIFPASWGIAKSFQTECFFLHTDHKSKAKWWGNLGGDHDYSKKLTKLLPINWIDDLIVCKPQEGKGHGQKKDKDGIYPTCVVESDKMICCLGLLPVEKIIRQDEYKLLKYSEAIPLEQKGKIKITFSDVTVINNTQGASNV